MKRLSLLPAPCALTLSLVFSSFIKARPGWCKDKRDITIYISVAKRNMILLLLLY